MKIQRHPQHEPSGILHNRIPAPGSEDFGCPGVSEWQPGEGWALLALLTVWCPPLFRYFRRRSSEAA